MAGELVIRLRPYVERIEIAGSLRREKSYVHDIELVFIPKSSVCTDLLGGVIGNRDEAHGFIQFGLLDSGIVAKRPSRDGRTVWGPKNKLSWHVESGIPIDFFSTVYKNWVNTLFVRTGGKKNNLMVTMGANKRGWSFEAYGSGFHRLNDHSVRHESASEEDIFAFVGLPYREPCLRP